MMDFEDVLVFFNRIGVRIVNDHVMRVYGDVDGVGDDVETHVVKSVYKIQPPSNCHTIRIEFTVRDEIDTFFGGFIHNKVLKGGDSSHKKKLTTSSALAIQY